MKDITDEAKQRAAAENLSVGNYGNTINGMKQELSDIKTVMLLPSVRVCSSSYALSLIPMIY